MPPNTFPNILESSQQVVRDLPLTSQTILNTSQKLPLNLSEEDTKINLRKINIFFHSTLGLLFFVLLFSPVITLLNRALPGHAAVFLESYKFTEGLYVMALGWLGIFIFCFSWYWFIGYIIIALNIKSGLRRLYVFLLNIFFIACLSGLSIYGEGKSAPGGVDQGIGLVGKHLSGYYIYITLILFLMFFSISLLKEVSISVRLITAKVLSACAILGVGFFTYFFNPIFNTSLIDNSAAYATIRKVEDEQRNLELFNQTANSYFENAKKVDFPYDNIRFSCNNGRCSDSIQVYYDGPTSLSEIKSAIEGAIVDKYVHKLLELKHLYLEDSTTTQFKFVIVLDVWGSDRTMYTCVYSGTERLECLNN